MKKILIAAVAAALVPAAAMAEVAVYGRIHTSVDSISGVAAQTDSIYVNSNSSRFGVKGSEDLGKGVKGVFQIESGITSTQTKEDGNGVVASGSLFTKQRDTYVGLSGGFGTFLTGRLGGSNQYVYDSNLFGDQIGDAATFTNTIPGRVNGALFYQTPDMGGLKAGLSYLPATSVNDTTGNTTGGNSYGLKLDYANAGITANFAYFNVKASSTTTLTPMSLAGSYAFGNSAMVTAQYVKATTSVSGADTTRNIYNIGGKYSLSSDSTIKAQYSKAGESTTSGATNAGSGASMIAVGYDYSLSKKAGLYVAYAVVNNDSAATYVVDNYGHGGNSTGPAVGEDPSGISVGITYDF